MLIDINGCEGTKDEVNYLEYVVLVITIEHTSRGALEIDLTSPRGK